MNKHVFLKALHLDQNTSLLVAIWDHFKGWFINNTWYLFQCKNLITRYRDSYYFDKMVGLMIILSK